MDPRVPHGPHGWEDHSFAMLPFLGNFLFLLLILALVAHRALSVAPRQASAGESRQAIAGGGGEAHPRRALRPRRHHFR